MLICRLLLMHSSRALAMIRLMHYTLMHSATRMQVLLVHYITLKDWFHRYVQSLLIKSMKKL